MAVSSFLRAALPASATPARGTFTISAENAAFMDINAGMKTAERLIKETLFSVGKQSENDIANAVNRTPGGVRRA